MQFSAKYCDSLKLLKHDSSHWLFQIKLYSMDRINAVNRSAQLVFDVATNSTYKKLVNKRDKS